MKVAICDNCGVSDDCATYSKVPFLYGGLILRFLDTEGSEPPDELEICEQCREKLLSNFPKLAEALKTKRGEAPWVKSSCIK